MPRVMNAIRRFALDEGLRRAVPRGPAPAHRVRRGADRRPGRARTRSTSSAARSAPSTGSSRSACPARIARFHGTPSPAQQPPPDAPVDVDALLAEWHDVHARGADRRQADRHVGPFAAGKPLEGLRVVDFTWVLAGPFATRILGDLGADILKFQTAERATLVNSPDFPYFYVWNRSKRLVSLDMKRPEALDAIRRVVEQSDVLMENFSAGVLDRWGIGYEQVRAWNPGIIYVTMSGPGPRRTVVEDDHLRPDDPRAVRADLPVQPARPPRRRPRVLAQRPRRRAVRGDRRAGGGRGPPAHRRGPAHRHRPDGDRHVPHRPGRARPTSPTAARRTRSATPTRSASGARTRSTAAATSDEVADHVPQRRRLGAPVRDRLVGHRRPRRRPATSPRPQGASPRAAEIDARLRRWCASRTADAAAAALQANGVPGRQGPGRRRPDGRPAAARPRLLAHRPTTPCSATARTTASRRCGARTDLEPYVPSGAYIGEHNFEVYRDLAGMSDDDIAVGMGDGLFG